MINYLNRKDVRLTDFFHLLLLHKSKAFTSNFKDDNQVSMGKFVP